MNGLEGKRVLVTAGAGGIGRAIADTFGAHGARVHVCDIDERALAACAEAHPEYALTLCDASSEHQVAALFNDVEEKLGGLDVLVNNVGIAGPTARIEDISPEEWRRTVDTNLNSYFYCTRLAAPLLRRADGGAVVNISSVAGRLGYAFRTAYASTKWAIIGFTESLAKELGPDGVRVNAVLPGIVQGPRMDRVITARAKELGIGYEAMKLQYLERVSLRRMVTAQDVADTVFFLCSPAGRNISGQSLSVCGNVETL
ncbi:SDR family oxidoreductase [bacterium]|nr:MAG: SDR family oxidoreductase [bacterium]